MKRGRIEIGADILRIAKSRSGITKLVYQGNLNFNIVKRHLKLLMDRGLITVDGSQYETTDRGRQYLSTYEQLEMLS